MSGTEERGLFVPLDPALERTIRDANPWWRGEQIAGLKPVRRWAFDSLYRALRQGPTAAVVLTGPRRVGKTVLLQQVVDQLMRDGVDARRILRIQFDDLPSLRALEQPILTLAQWFAQSILGETFNRAALEQRPAFLLLDEVQNLQHWSDELKHLIDIYPVRALVTGSSSLRIEQGRDSLAGRVKTFVIGPLLLREIGMVRGESDIPPLLPVNGLDALLSKGAWSDLREHGMRHSVDRDRAFRLFADRGGYPDAHSDPSQTWDELAEHLNETVVRRAIQHDLRVGERGVKRDEVLLESVFKLACRYTGQAPGQALYLDELRESLAANVGWQRVLSYLRFLDRAILVRLVEPLELRLKKKRGPPKVCVCDHGLRAAWLHERVVLDPVTLRASPDAGGGLAGRVAEGIVGQFLKAIGPLAVTYQPERSGAPEVDFVLGIGAQRIPLEVKFRRRIDREDTLGLRRFVEKSANDAPFGVLVTLDDEYVSDDPRIVAVPLASLLLLR